MGTTTPGYLLASTITVPAGHNLVDGIKPVQHSLGLHDPCICIRLVPKVRDQTKPTVWRASFLRRIDYFSAGPRDKWFLS